MPGKVQQDGKTEDKQVVNDVFDPKKNIYDKAFPRSKEVLGLPTNKSTKRNKR